jgi:hypothetical protein
LGNIIDLNGAETALKPVVPAEALVAQYVENSGFLGDGITTNKDVTIANPAYNAQTNPDVPETITVKQTLKPEYKDYVWPNGMDFTSGLIGPGEKFILVDDGSNDPVGYNRTQIASTSNDKAVYYSTFYLLNAGSQNAIESLKFQVSSAMTLDDAADQAGDHTAIGFAAFIIFDEVTIAAGQTIPANAYGYSASTLAANETRVWIPFAAFTFETNNSDSEAYTTAAGSWQFADLTKKQGIDAATKYYRIGETYWDPAANDNAGSDVVITSENQGTLTGLKLTDNHDEDATKYYNNGTYYNQNGMEIIITNETYADHSEQLYTAYNYYYNDAAISTLPTQAKDADCVANFTATTGFELKTSSLQTLNNKGVYGNSVSGRTASEAGYDDASSFSMLPGEIYRVDFYYWLDGRSLTEYSDATLSEIGINVIAGPARNINAN